MSQPDSEALFDDSSEADRLDQEASAVPETTDHEDDSTPVDLTDTTEASEADRLDQSEEVDIDDEQLNRG